MRLTCWLESTLFRVWVNSSCRGREHSGYLRMVGYLHRNFIEGFLRPYFDSSAVRLRFGCGFLNSKYR